MELCSRKGDGAMLQVEVMEQCCRQVMMEPCSRQGDSAMLQVEVMEQCSRRRWWSNAADGGDGAMQHARCRSNAAGSGDGGRMQAAGRDDGATQQAGMTGGGPWPHWCHCRQPSAGTRCQRSSPGMPLPRSQMAAAPAGPRAEPPREGHGGLGAPSHSLAHPWAQPGAGDSGHSPCPWAGQRGFSG